MYRKVSIPASRSTRTVVSALSTLPLPDRPTTDRELAVVHPRFLSTVSAACVPHRAKRVSEMLRNSRPTSLETGARPGPRYASLHLLGIEHHVHDPVAIPGVGDVDQAVFGLDDGGVGVLDRKSTRLNSRQVSE